MKVSKTQIGAFIPQRAPFIMIDNLLEATSERYESDFLVAPDNIFLEGEVLREFALIENIAQTSAAGLAFLNRDDKDKPREGFIGGISKLMVYKLPNVNEKIQTTVTPLLKFENMYLLKGTSSVSGKKLLECEMKLAGVY